MGSKILKYNIYNDTMNDLINDIKKYEKVHIISGNPEVLFNGLNNPALFENYISKDSIIVPDGIGTVLASRLVRQPVKEKIAGIEVMENILKQCSAEKKAVYLVGAEQEVLDQCVSNIHKKYPNLNIAGAHNGFFDLNNCEYLIQDIMEKKPHALFVAMGAPRQENFILKYMDILPCKIYMGVGGSFDVFAGKVNRAPEWMINIGMEWLYRVSKEPWRLKRLGSIPKFLLKVIFDTYIIKDKE